MKGGVVPVRVVAARWGATQRCALRRLKRMNERIGGGLLVQFAARGHYFADLAMLRKYLPGLAHDDEEGPSVAALAALAELREMISEVLERVA